MRNDATSTESRELDDTVESSLILMPSYTDVVYQTMRKNITRGVYESGPINLKSLAATFGVSTIPVREALRRLEADGLVTFGPSRRIVINGLSDKESRDVFAIRLVLETLALERAIPTLRSSQEQLRNLEQLVAEMDRKADHPDDWRVLNQEFHRIIYAAAAIPRLEAMIASLWVAHEPYLRLYVNVIENFREAQEEHRLILAAIKSGDIEKAAKLLRKHLETTAAIVHHEIGKKKPKPDVVT